MISLHDVSKSIREPNGQPRVLFENLNFHLADDEPSIAIVGRSGSGKSSLLRILAGLDTNYTGDYYHAGQHLGKNLASLAEFRMDNVGIVSQRYDLLSDRNVLQNVLFGLRDGKNATAKAMECLARVHLEGFERKRVNQLSGGEAQRVAIARALVKEPRIILADEPTGALDESTEDTILGLFQELQDRGTRFVIATHSTKVARSCAQTLVMKDRQLFDISG